MIRNERIEEKQSKEKLCLKSNRKLMTVILANQHKIWQWNVEKQQKQTETLKKTG